MSASTRVSTTQRQRQMAGTNRWCLSLLTASILATACGEDEPVTDGGSAATVGGEGAAGDVPLGGNAAGGAAAGGGPVDSVVDDGCDDELAKGITISELAVFQAGKITVMRDGFAMTPTTTHGASIVQGKDSLFRVHVTVDGDFQPRELSARLELNGRSEGYYARATISGSSSEFAAESSFNIEVPGSAITSSLDYQLRIVECGVGSGAEHGPVFPASGVAALPTRSTGIVKITMVPVTSGGVTPTLDETFANELKAVAESMYPTTGIEITLDDTPAGDCSLTSANARDGEAWAECGDILRARRASDQPPDDVYYVGILKPEPTYEEYCNDECYNGYSLIGGVDGPSFRVAVLTAYLPHVAELTFPHELGHSHGLRHAPGCGAGNLDPNFPYVSDDTSGIGWVGWNQQRSPLEFLDPAQYADVMSYCTSPWISDYSYAKIADRIAALQAARFVSGPARTWRVLLESTGKLRWGIPLTTPVPAEGEATAASALDARGKVIAPITVYGVRTSLGGAVYMVPNPEAGWAAIEIGGRALAF